MNAAQLTSSTIVALSMTELISVVVAVVGLVGLIIVAVRTYDRKCASDLADSQAKDRRIDQNEKDLGRLTQQLSRLTEQVDRMAAVSTSPPRPRTRKTQS